MKNKTPAKTAGKKNATPAKSPITKAKDALKPVTPKNVKGVLESPAKSPGKSPKPQNGIAQNGGSAKKGKKNKANLNKTNSDIQESTPTPKQGKNTNKKQNGSSAKKEQKKKAEKISKVPVMNEPSDDSASDSGETHTKLPKFGGVAALGDNSPSAKTSKQGKKNKLAPESAKEDSENVPAKKAKKDKSILKADGAKKKQKSSKTKRRISLVRTLLELAAKNDLAKMTQLLPTINGRIQELQGIDTRTAKRHLRKLKVFEKKIKTGCLLPTVQAVQAAKGAKKEKKGKNATKKLLNVTATDEDDEENWQDKINSVASDDEDDNDADPNVVSDEEDDEILPKPKQGKKLKAVKNAEDKSTKPQAQSGKNRYVLFVGNLAYETTDRKVEEHFAKTGNLISVRLNKDKETNRSKGFAFVELGSEEAFQRGLSMDNSQLDNRRIRVTLTNKKEDGNKKKSTKVKDLKLKAMKSKGLLAGSKKDSQTRSARRKKAAAAKNTE